MFHGKFEPDDIRRIEPGTLYESYGFEIEKEVWFTIPDNVPNNVPERLGAWRWFGTSQGK
jgi:hypothetical protein